MFVLKYCCYYAGVLYGTILLPPYEILLPITLVEGNPYAVLTFDRRTFATRRYPYRVISWEVFHGSWVLVEGNRYSLLEQGFLYITNVSIMDAGVYRVNIYYFTNCHIVQVRKVDVGNTMLLLPTMTEVCKKIDVNCTGYQFGQITQIVRSHQSTADTSLHENTLRLSHPLLIVINLTDLTGVTLKITRLTRRDYWIFK